MLLTFKGYSESGYAHTALIKNYLDLDENSKEELYHFIDIDRQEKKKDYEDYDDYYDDYEIEQDDYASRQMRPLI